MNSLNFVEDEHGILTVIIRLGHSSDHLEQIIEDEPVDEADGERCAPVAPPPPPPPPSPPPCRMLVTEPSVSVHAAPLSPPPLPPALGSVSCPPLRTHICRTLGHTRTVVAMCMSGLTVLCAWACPCPCTCTGPPCMCVLVCLCVCICVWMCGCLPGTGQVPSTHEPSIKERSAVSELCRVLPDDGAITVWCGVHRELHYRSGAAHSLDVLQPVVWHIDLVLPTLRV